MDEQQDNLARWRHYLCNITSPDIFINIGFYYMISASLQRRVYMGSDEFPLFPNVYTVLVGPPGVGKNLVIKPISEFIKHHKLRKRPAIGAPNAKPKAADDDSMTSAEIEQQMAILRALQAEADGQGAQALPEQPTGHASAKPPSAQQQARNLDEPLLIPIAADATTYEALVRNHSRSLRSIVTGSPSRLVRNGIYAHSSLCFALEEISSLFRKHTEDVVNYLLKAYDCGDYVYETKNQGIDKVKSMCLNLIAGTTPSFMKSAFNDKLLTEGFSSRSWFVYAPENRFEKFDMGGTVPSQLAAKEHILAHIERLTRLFGLVTYTPEARDWMKHFVEVELPKQRKMSSSKLEYYYSRKNMHIQKLAMAIHFSDSTEMVVDILPCRKAETLLALIESNMEKALDIGGRNPLGPIIGRVERHIRNHGPLAFSEVWRYFVDDTNEMELGEVLNFLMTTGRVRTREVIKQPENISVKKYYV